MTAGKAVKMSKNKIRQKNVARHNPPLLKTDFLSNTFQHQRFARLKNGMAVPEEN